MQKTVLVAPAGRGRVFIIIWNALDVRHPGGSGVTRLGSVMIAIAAGLCCALILLRSRGIPKARNQSKVQAPSRLVCKMRLAVVVVGAAWRELVTIRACCPHVFDAIRIP